MESLWEGNWLPLGAPVKVTADSPPAALALVETVGLRPRVTYRIHILAPGVDLRTEPTQTPELPTLA
jgi:hypothetical protein